MIKLYICRCSKENEHDAAAELARYALFDVYGVSAELKKDARGKPFFNEIPAHISLSHSNGLCLAAISDSKIGADIEEICGDGERLMRIAGRYFTPDETEYVKAFPRERFFEIWCKKESYIKYTGEGFSRSLSSFSVFDTEVVFSYFEFEGYGVGVCSTEKVVNPPMLAEITKTDKQYD